MPHPENTMLTRGVRLVHQVPILQNLTHAAWKKTGPSLVTSFNQWPLKARCRKITNGEYLLLSYTVYSGLLRVYLSKACHTPMTTQLLLGLLCLFIASSSVFKHYSYAPGLSSVQTLSRSHVQASGNSDLNKCTGRPGWSSSTSCGFPARIEGACQMTGAVTAIMADHLLSGTHKSWQCAHRRGGGALGWWVCTLPHAV